MSKKFKLMLTGLLVIIALAVFGLYYASRPAAGQLVSVQQGPMSETITETAELCAYDRAALYTFAPQTIATVHTTIGQPVAQGDLLISYESTSDLELAQLQAQRQAAAAQYDGQIAAAALSADTASQAAEAAQKHYDRQKQLYAAGALSQQALESDESALEQAVNALHAAQAELSGLQTQRQAQLEQIDASFALLAQKHQAAILTAPFDGIVTECPFSAGAQVPLGALVVEVQNPNRLYLQTELLMEDAARLSSGTTVSAAQEDYGLTIDGLVISQMAPKVRQTTSALGVEQKRLPVQVALPEGALSVPLGSPWTVTFTLSAFDETLWLPKAAVYIRHGQSVVLLPDGRTEQPVVIGIRQEDRVQILDGLSLDDKVLLPE